MQPVAAEGSEARTIPVRMGSAQQFQALRSGLEESHYNEAAICARTGAPSIFEFQRIMEGRQTGVEVNDALDVLIRLLMDGEALAEDRVRALLPATLVDALTDVGVLEQAPDHPLLCCATVALYPVLGVYIASDRAVLVGGGDAANLRDSVYPAITKNTRWFLSGLPETPCPNLLDLCSGTGVAALVAAKRCAGPVWSCDLVERSVRFAEFNCALNGIENITCARGDLYEPVAELTFDRIVAHPPYVPAPEQKVLFRDGGEDGEQILRGVIEGLPRHLRPGGRCYCVAMATDREGEALEQRIRHWLGEKESEFDVMLVGFGVETKPESLLQVMKSKNSRCLQLPGHSQTWERLKVTGIFLGAMIVQRKATDRPAVTARTRRAEEAGSDAVEWFVRWTTASAAPDFDNVLRQARPHLAATLQLRVTHTVEDRALTPTRFELEAGYPFHMEAVCPNWLAVVAGACDGKTTVQEVYADMKRQEVIHPAMTMEQFVGNIRTLVTHGVLELDEFPLPKRAARTGA